MRSSMKILVALVIACGASAAQAAPIVLSTGLGGSANFAINGVTIGSTLSFEYQFSDVLYSGGSFIGINSNFVNPCCGDQFNDYRAANTGWLLASIGTAGTASPNDLVFTATTFGAAGNSATVTIRNVMIDQTVIGGATAVPEPATLALLGLGLAGLGLARRRRQ